MASIGSASPSSGVVRVVNPSELHLRQACTILDLPGAEIVRYRKQLECVWGVTRITDLKNQHNVLQHKRVAFISLDDRTRTAILNIDFCSDTVSFTFEEIIGRNGEKEVAVVQLNGMPQFYALIGGGVLQKQYNQAFAQLLRAVLATLKGAQLNEEATHFENIVNAYLQYKQFDVFAVSMKQFFEKFAQKFGNDPSQLALCNAMHNSQVMVCQFLTQSNNQNIMGDRKETKGSSE